MKEPFRMKHGDLCSCRHQPVLQRASKFLKQKLPLEFHWQMEFIEFLGNLFPLLQIHWGGVEHMCVIQCTLCGLCKCVALAWWDYFSSEEQDFHVGSHQELVSGFLLHSSTAVENWTIIQTLILTPAPWECGTDFWPLGEPLDKKDSQWESQNPCWCTSA